jgi:hypothetical protein
MGACKTAVLTRQQMEQILMFMRLHENVETVIILENNVSGIGSNMYARFYQRGSQTYQEIDITDVDNW